MLSQIGNFIAFQVGWFTCVLGAASHRPWLGPFVVFLLLGVHVWQTRDSEPAIRIIVLIGGLGTIIDSGLGYLEILQYRDSLIASWVSPPWLVAIWTIFATTLKHSLRWLEGRPILAITLGAGVGPLSYYAGHRLGALALAAPLIETLIALAFLWGLLLPTLVWMSAEVARRAEMD